MDYRLTKWHTANLINEVIDSDLQFFNNYSGINAEMAEIYKELKEYRTKHYTEYSRHSYGGEYITKKHMPFFDKLLEMQLYVQGNPEDDKGILKMSKELFGIPDVKNAIAVEQEIYNKLQILIEYAEPVKDLFNNVNNLVNKGSSYAEITMQQEGLIKQILETNKLAYT